MVSVETDMAGLVMPGTREEIIQYMKSQGYQHRRHGVESTFSSGSVKDDLFIREDVVSKYSLTFSTTTNTNTPTTIPTTITASNSKNKVEL